MKGGQKFQIQDCGGLNKDEEWGYLGRIINVEGVKKHTINVKGGYCIYDFCYKAAFL